MRAGNCSKCSIKMEDVLDNIKSLAIQLNLEELKLAAQEALDLLAVQHGSVRDEPYKLRAKCFVVFSKCFETKKAKLMGHATSGLQKMVKDDRFHSTIEPQDDSEWLTSQLLQATHSFLSLPDDIQVDILKVYLNVVSSKSWTLNGRIVLSILGLCIDAYESGNAAVKAAAQAAACQTLRTFCSVLEEEFDPKDKQATAFNEILPIMQFVTSKIDEGESSGRCEQRVGFQLECMLTLCSSLPLGVQGNQHFRTFFWQKLCPGLISVLGTPRVDKNIVTRSGSVEEEKGRGSGGLAAAPSFSSNHAKTVYSISNELVRLFGRLGPLRPVLESVFHRVLLYPPPEYRYDAIKSTAELFANPLRVMDMAGPLSEPEIGFQKSEMSLMRLIMDSLDESSNSKSRSCDVAITCCVSLLKTLQELCSGNSIPNDRADLIRALYPRLEDCDYRGPKTYPSSDRLPRDYQNQMMQDGLPRTDPVGDAEKQSGSDSPTETDGPDEEDVDEDSKELDEESKVRSEISGNWFYGQGKVPVTLNDTEIQHAEHFIGKLNELLPELRNLRSCIEIDQAFQTFAAEYCIGVILDYPQTEWAIILNSDSVYFVTYSLLLLDLTLNRCNYFTDPRIRAPISEDDFANEMEKNAFIGYLSGALLRELYQFVVSSSLLRAHKYLPAPNKYHQHALINLLTDMQGVDPSLEGSEMLSECWKLEKARLSTKASVEVQAGIRLCRKVLTCCWDSIFKLLSVPLTKKKYSFKSFNLKNLRFALDENRGKLGKETTANALEGLLIAANLFGRLGLQDRCGHILELLASASCPPKGEKKRYSLLRQDYITSTECLTTAHALNIELIIGSGLELGSRCPSCWPHIFRSCVYVKKLERNFFSKPEHRALGTSLNIIKKEEKSNPDGETGESSQPEEKKCGDVYSFLIKSGGPETVSQIISSRKTGLSSTELMNPAETARVICTLSHLVDKLFEDAAFKLNLKSLEIFSRCLCIASHRQLFPQPSEEGSSKSSWWSKFKLENNDDCYLLLDSLGEVILKCVKSGRPLIHFMKLWALIGPYLMASASHKDVAIGLKAIQHMHDMISTYFNVHTELPYFHVNESLFKPFENLLCLELCNPEVRDQILNCFTKFAEGNYNEVYSGWRPIFSAIRVMPQKFDSVPEIFATFLEASDPVVFGNAAVDFVLCLLNQIHRSGNLKGTTMDEFSKYLIFLKRAQLVLSTFYKVSRGLVFYSAHRIQVSEPMLVDSNIPNLEFVKLDNVPDDLIIEPKVSYATLTVNSLGPTLDSIDRTSGALRIWLLLMEGMLSAAIAAKSEFQPKILDRFFNDLIELRYQTDYLFGLYCINRFVIPTTQSWLRQLSKNDSSDYSGFKQSIGLLSDIIESYFVDRPRNERSRKSLTMLVTQITLLLAECCIHPADTVATLASACFRHILSEAGYYFNQDQWKVSSMALYKACDVTLNPIRQLMMAFSKGSQSFYGDNNQIKIAARNDATLRDIIHLKQLWQQVFLLDCQREEIVTGEENELVTESTYTFLVTVSDEVVVRIPMKSLVSALLSHQSLLQVIASVLVQANYMSPSLMNDLFINIPSAAELGDKTSDKPFTTGLKGLLSDEAVKILLGCLDISFHTAIVFDSRPGLKFLVQKVGSLERAANLYRQARAAWTIKMAALFQICSSHIGSSHVDAADVKRYLEYPMVETRHDLETYLRELREHFNDLCSTYVDLVSDKDGAQKSSENIPDEPVPLDIACEDEYNVPVAKETDKPEDSVFKPVLTEPFIFSDCPSQRYDFPSSSSSDESDEENDKKKWMKLAADLKMELQKVADVGDNSKRDGKITGRERGENEATGTVKNSSHDLELVKEILIEYRRRKNEYLNNKEQALMKPSNVPNPPEPSIPPELEMQRSKSFLKDEEARRKIFSQMFTTVFELLTQLEEEKFRVILPVFFDGIRILTAHASDMPVKEVVAALFRKISLVFGFGLS